MSVQPNSLIYLYGQIERLIESAYILHVSKLKEENKSGVTISS